jgi:hypothetical protein
MTDDAARLDAIEARLREMEARCAGAVASRVKARAEWGGLRLLEERIAEEDLAALVGWVQRMVDEWRRLDSRALNRSDYFWIQSLARALGIEVA